MQANGCPKLEPADEATDSKSGCGIAISGVQSVIQSNQQSVIQSATGQPTVLTKGNVILVSKPSSVIQTAQGSLQTLQVVVEPADGDSRYLAKKRRSATPHSPGLRRLVEECLAPEAFPKLESSGSECDSNLDSELSSDSISVSGNYHTMLRCGEPDAQTTGSGGTILQYASQEGQFYVPGEIVVIHNPSEDGATGGEQVKKRAIRLLKNREAARECRRKKKEYIKCLESRVAVLEAQNKSLVEELTSLKELYCLQNIDEEGVEGV